jgi:hypothetical protein
VLYSENQVKKFKFTYRDGAGKKKFRSIVTIFIRVLTQIGYNKKECTEVQENPSQPHNRKKLPFTLKWPLPSLTDSLGPTGKENNSLNKILYSQ